MAFWREWRGSLDGRPTLWIRVLAAAFGCKVQLHKMVAPDDPGCFHTHPATAIRIVLWGGYWEETDQGKHVHWRPGRIGIVRPDFAHRIARLANGRSSWSLWIRGRKTTPIRLVGSGWPRQDDGGAE